MSSKQQSGKGMQQFTVIARPMQLALNLDQIVVPGMRRTAAATDHETTPK